MKSQNETLKTELSELAKQMDDHVVKDKETQVDKNVPADFDEKGKEIKNFQKKIHKNREIIVNLKRQLEQTYDFDRIIEAEDNLKILKGKLDLERDNHYSLNKNSKNQQQVLEDLVDQGQFLT